MIGVINRTKIFEFRDQSELARALDFLAKAYGCETIIIVNASDKVKGIIYNGDFSFTPDIFEEEKYYIYGNANSNGSDLGKNESLPVQRDWQLYGMPFMYVSQPVSKELDV